MNAGPDRAIAAALLRMIRARAPQTEIAVYAVRDGAMQFWGRTTPGGGPIAEEREWRSLDPALAALLDAGEGGQPVDGAAVGLAAAEAVQPLRGRNGVTNGFLALADADMALQADRASALADAALVAAALIEAALSPPSMIGAVQTARPPCGELGGTLRDPGREGLPAREAAVAAIDAVRSRRDAGWSLFMIDLDRFHSLNEALGDAAGNALLTAIGARLETCLGLGERFARLEGDRFVVLAGRRREQAPSFAAGLLAAAGEPLQVAGRTVVVQVSIGVVAGLNAGVSTQAAFNQAEAALRRAKAEGRNRFVLHEPGRAAATRDASRLELDLAEATARGQMRLAYQGYVELAGGDLSGVEALMRWRHPVRGELPPTYFIPLAEATGLILPLGAWALRTALDAARRWPERLQVSVNVSALQFHQPSFVREVEAALATTGVAPERLELEITETVLMRNNPETTAQLQALIALGVRIALDDFGTGYSALAYLGRLPHHRIKLDRSFVQDLGNPATLELVRAIIALARKTGVAVTAEGVERPDQLEAVRALGFSHAQGFATGRPVADPIGLMEAVARFSGRLPGDPTRPGQAAGNRS